jgi:hypothetical protein
MKLPLLIIATLCGMTLIAQPQKTNYWKVGITTSEYGSLFLGSEGLFSTFNPGIEIGYLESDKTAKNHQWQHELSVGYNYHRYMGHTVSLGFNENYRYFLPAGFNISARFGAGLDLWKVPTVEFVYWDESIEEFNFGIKKLFTLNAAIGIDKQINKRGVTIGLLYQQKAQMFYIFFPLPSNSMMLSMKFPIKKK